MNTTQRNLTRFTMIAATLAAAFMVQAAHAGTKEVRTVQLAPVVVVAKRVPVVQLERVVIVAKRAVPAGTVVAQRGLRNSRV
jgi:hypothetical protein